MVRWLLLRKMLLTVVKENETVIFVCMWTRETERETEEEQRDRVKSQTRAHTHIQASSSSFISCPLLPCAY